VEWDGTDDAGHKVGSGVYWTQMKFGDDFLSTKKMLLLK
jgi:flagellar hook assembly protein FlgD